MILVGVRIPWPPEHSQVHKRHQYLTIVHQPAELDGLPRFEVYGLQKNLRRAESSSGQNKRLGCEFMSLTFRRMSNDASNSSRTVHAETVDIHVGNVLEFRIFSTVSECQRGRIERTVWASPQAPP